MKYSLNILINCISQVCIIDNYTYFEIMFNFPHDFQHILEIYRFPNNIFIGENIIVFFMFISNILCVVDYIYISWLESNNRI